MGMLALSLVACGYPSPPGGGGLTPYVVEVTPTPLPATATAYADATVLARNTPTPLPLTFAVRPTTATSSSGPNTAGTAGAGPTPTATLGVQGDEYTVQSGDTLLGIAIRFNVDFQELVALNKITDPNSIRAGQKLKLPQRKVGTPSGPTQPPSAPTPTPFG